MVIITLNEIDVVTQIRHVGDGAEMGTNEIKIEEYDVSVLGKKYNKQTKEFEEFHQETPENWQITRLAFRNRFTQKEKANLEMAALDNPNADQETRLKSAQMRAYLKDVDAAQYIDLKAEPIIDGVQYLEAIGLIDSGRADQILNRPILESER